MAGRCWTSWPATSRSEWQAIDEPITLHHVADRMTHWYAGVMAERPDARPSQEILPFVRRVCPILQAVVALIVILSHLPASNQHAI